MLGLAIVPAGLHAQKQLQVFASIVDAKGAPAAALEPGDVRLLENDAEAKVTKVVRARDIWNKIIDAAWSSAEPGLLFWDTVKRNTPTEVYAGKGYGSVSTNPCGEIWLEEYGSCDLGALVLPRFVDSYGNFNFNLLKMAINSAVRFLDNVLTVNEYPLDVIAENNQTVRRLGLGIMGLHSMLIKMGMPYSSRMAKDFIDSLMDFIKIEAYESSIALSVEKGPFPAYKPDFLNSGFVRRALPNRIKNSIEKHGIRNCALLTIAPTGTSPLADAATRANSMAFAIASSYFITLRAQQTLLKILNVLQLLLIVHLEIIRCHRRVLQVPYDPFLNQR